MNRDVPYRDIPSELVDAVVKDLTEKIKELTQSKQFEQLDYFEDRLAFIKKHRPLVENDIRTKQHVNKSDVQRAVIRIGQMIERDIPTNTRLEQQDRKMIIQAIQKACHESLTNVLHDKIRQYVPEFVNTVVEKAIQKTIPGEDFRNGGGITPQEAEIKIVERVKKTVCDLMIIYLKKYFKYYVDEELVLTDLQRDVDILFEQLSGGTPPAKPREFGGGKGKTSKKILTGPRGGKYVIRNGRKIYFKR
jgi:hypothetical protein